MKLLTLTISILLMASITMLSGQQKTINTDRAAKFFKTFDQLRESDNGSLWGHKLPHKMLFINPQNYEFVANEPLQAYGAKKDGKLFRGQYPQNKAIANTSVLIDSTPWTMVMWPLSEKSDEALELMAHESFHNLQNLLGIKISVMAIPHMDKKDARMLFRLEMNALYEALYSNNQEAVKHALYFRKMRFDQYPGTKNEEILLETQEGLAQYTGFKLGYNAQRLKMRLQENIRNMSKKSSLSRATAYTSGPLYGLLLDASGKPWKNGTMQNFNAFELTLQHFDIDPQSLSKLQYDEIKQHYNFDKIESEENLRWKKRQKKIEQYTNKLLEDQPLIIELVDKQIGFNPNSIIPLEPNGNVYEYFVLRDWFGVLTAKKGALMSNDWNRVNISKPTKINQDTIEGDGWVIKLKEECEVVKNKDHYGLVKNKKK